MAIVGPTPSPAEPVPEEFDLVCEGCGYSLVGLIDSTRCPECGREFDPKQLPLARVPWLYRKRIGTLTAYWQTIQLIRRDPRAFAIELCRPVRISKTDAKQFRRFTIYIVVATVLLIIATIWALAIASHQITFNVRGNYDDYVGMSVAGLLWVWISAYGNTDMPTFIWKGLPADPVELTPLHHYACAPLSMYPLPVIVGSLGYLCLAMLPDEPAVGAVVLGLAAITFIMMLWRLWRLPQIFMSVATQCSRERIIGLGLYMPLHWTLISATAFGISILIGGIAVWIVSLIF